MKVEEYMSAKSLNVVFVEIDDASSSVKQLRISSVTDYENVRQRNAILWIKLS